MQAVWTSLFMKCISSFLLSIKSHDKSLHIQSILALLIILIVFIFIDFSFFFWSLEFSSHCICKCLRSVKAWLFYCWICAWYCSVYSVRNWHVAVLDIRAFSFNKWSLNQRLSSWWWINALSKAVAKQSTALRASWIVWFNSLSFSLTMSLMNSFKRMKWRSKRRWFELFHADNEAISRALMISEESTLISVLDIDTSQKRCEDLSSFICLKSFQELTCMFLTLWLSST